MDLEGLQRAVGPMQEAMRKADAERASTVIEGRAGGGAVVIRISGDLQMKGVSVLPAVAHGDAAMLEDLIGAALSDALRQHRTRFGANPEEQMARMMRSSDMGALMAMLGGR
jgi:hypothetical protein